MVSAVSTSTAALSAAFQRFDASATRVASPQGAADPTRAAVDLVSAKTEVGITTALLKSSLASDRRVLDILV